MRADVKACLHIFKHLSVAVFFFFFGGGWINKIVLKIYPGCHLARDWDICCCDLAPISVLRREADSPPHLMSCLVKLSSTSSLMTAWLNPRLTFGLVPLHWDLNIHAKSFTLICVSFFFLLLDWPLVASQAILSLLTTPLLSPTCHALDLFPPGFKNLSRVIRFQTDSSSSKLLHTVHSKETVQSNSLFACTNLAKKPSDFDLDMIPPGPRVYLRWTPLIGSQASYSL